MARWLPSPGVRAWRSAQLLAWRVQCLGRVCAALAAGAGGSGRYVVSCLPRFPLPAPHVPRCVWWAVWSGCPLCSLAGTPFYTVCAVRGLDSVALLVFPACPVCVCVRWRSRGIRFPPPLPEVGVTHAPCAVPVLGAGRAVPRCPCFSACPSLVPCSIWRAGGGGSPVPNPPYLAWGCALPVRWVCASVVIPCWGMGWGGGDGLCAVPPVCAAGVAIGAGGRSASFRPSAFPGQATKRVSLASFSSSGFLVMEGVAPIPLRLVLACRLRARSVWRPGVLVRVCLFTAVAVGAGGWGGGGGLAPAPLSGAAVLPGGRGTIPSASGGWGPAPLRLLGRMGGGWGGVAPQPPCSPSGGRPAAPHLAPLSSPAHSPPGVRVWSGSRRRLVHRVRPAWRGGGRGGP